MPGPVSRTWSSTCRPVGGRRSISTATARAAWRPGRSGPGSAAAAGAGPGPPPPDGRGRWHEPQGRPPASWPGPATRANTRSRPPRQVSRRRSGCGGRAKSRNVCRVRSMRRISCSITAGPPPAGRALRLPRLTWTSPLIEVSGFRSSWATAGGHLADGRHLLGPEQVLLVLLPLVPPLRSMARASRLATDLNEMNVLVGEPAIPGWYMRQVPSGPPSPAG